MKYINKFLLLLFLSIQLVFAQRGVSSTLFHQVENEIQSIVGKNYELDHLISVDDQLLSLKILGIKIDRSDETLKGAYIFTVTGRQIEYGNAYKGFIGVYKNNHILWHSDLIINDSFLSNSFVEAVMDLNNDGKMEIITLWTDTQGNVEYLWIFSWDGIQGTLLNDVDEGGQSVIVSIPQYFLINDLNGDGILEINGSWSNDVDVAHANSKIVYSWNGQKYGKWSNAPQVPPSGFLTRNKVMATVNANVESADENNLKYKYKIENSKTSLQEINDFRIGNSIMKCVNQGGRNSWRSTYGRYDRIGWLNLSMEANYIQKGEIDSSFYYITSGLPAINKFYLRGYNESDTVIFDSQKNKEDYFSNSVIGITIGAADPPSPFIPLPFLDTLLSYTYQSVQLGWLIDKNAEKRIDQKIELAKRLLQMAENCAANPKKTDLLEEATRAIKEGEMVIKKEYRDEIIQGLQKPVMEENKELKQFEKELTKKRLDKAKCKELCEKVYTWLAIKTLESLVYEVEILNKLTESGKHQYLTSEAYALLKYNTEYLIGQLKK